MKRIVYSAFVLFCMVGLSSCAATGNPEADDTGAAQRTVDVSETNDQAPGVITTSEQERADVVVQIDLERVVIDREEITELEHGNLPLKAHYEQNPESYLIPAVTAALDAGNTAGQTSGVATLLELDPLVPAETVGKVLYSSVQAKHGPGSGATVVVEIGDWDSFDITLPTITREPPEVSEPSSLKPLHATVAIAQDGIYVAAGGRRLEGPRDCVKNMTFCHGQDAAMVESLRSLRENPANSSARTEYIDALESYHWNELAGFWSATLKSHPSNEYRLRDTLNVSVESWMPVELLARIHQTTCIRDTKQSDSDCNRYFETVVFNLLFAE